MKTITKLIATAGIVGALGTTTAFAATGLDFQQFGFPTVVAQATIPVGQGATLTADGATITVPSGAFTDPVKFELLEGPLANFTAKAPAGQTPLYDFAFKVIDQNTNNIIIKFQKPVVFSYTSAKVNANSRYYDIDTSGNYTLNPKPATIVGNTITHGNIGAPVGWVVTSPTSSVSSTTSPVTGLPLESWLYVGGGLIVAGGLLLVARRRVS